MFRTKSDVDVTKDRLVETLTTTRDALAPRISAARDVVTPYVDTASARVAPYLDEARVRLSPAVERIGPAVDTARARIKTEVVPAMIAAAETARENSAPARAEAKERATGALLALRGEGKKARRWPVALFCLATGAAAGAAVGILRRAPQANTSVAPPTPFPAAGTTPTTTGTTDVDDQSVHGAATTSRLPGS